MQIDPQHPTAQHKHKNIRNHDFTAPDPSIDSPSSQKSNNPTVGRNRKFGPPRSENGRARARKEIRRHPTLTTCRIATGKEYRPQWPKLDEFREKCRKEPCPVRPLHCTAQSTQVEVPSNGSHPQKPATAQNAHNINTKLRNIVHLHTVPRPHNHRYDALRKPPDTRSFHRTPRTRGKITSQQHLGSVMWFRPSPSLATPNTSSPPKHPTGRAESTVRAVKPKQRGFCCCGEPVSHSASDTISRDRASRGLAYGGCNSGSPPPQDMDRNTGWTPRVKAGFSQIQGGRLSNPTINVACDRQPCSAVGNTRQKF